MTRSPSLTTIVPLLAVLALPAIGHAATFSDELSDLREAVSFGKVSGTARYRYEYVEQENIDEKAYASTLRTALGYETKSYHGITGFAQFEGVFLVGEDHYRNADNLDTRYPLVADTPTVELNQAWGQYICPKDPWKTAARWGRQEILLGNQRMVGNVAWRQDQQTFDGGSVTTTPWNSDGKSVSLGYSYLYRVNRIFPDDSLTSAAVPGAFGRLDMDTHVGQGTFKWDGIGQLHLYGLFLDYDSDVATVIVTSTATLGGRLSGVIKATDDVGVLYGAEYANQTDYGSNPNDYSVAYYQGEVGALFAGVTLKYGYNVLEGSDSTLAPQGNPAANEKFTTPLATGHAFNGWCDMFLNTPQNGLEAHQISLSYNPSFLKGLTLTGVYYILNAESVSQHFGDEIDLLAEYKVASFPGLLVGAKYAMFDGDEVDVPGAVDLPEEVTKFWLYTQYAF
jgi:hypothetical protein